MTEEWVAKIEQAASAQLGIKKWYKLPTGSSKTCSEQVGKSPDGLEVCTSDSDACEF